MDMRIRSRRSAVTVARIVPVVFVAGLVSMAGLVSGCNVIIGTEAHDEFPDNCGAESLTSAQASFSDDRNGHCYSRVLSDDPEEGTDFATAKDSCTAAGGALACVNDADELELITRNVTSRAWLGMNALAVSSLQSFSCITGERFEPGAGTWADGHPSSDEGGPCTVLANGRVESRGCWGGVQYWLCELEPTTSD
jgi:hypothetical protein